MPHNAPMLPLTAFEVGAGRVRFFLLGNAGGPLVTTDWIADPAEALALVVQLVGPRPEENDIERAAAPNADEYG